MARGPQGHLIPSSPLPLFGMEYRIWKGDPRHPPLEGRSKCAKSPGGQIGIEREL
jgi:hypothetical protein